MDIQEIDTKIDTLVGELEKLKTLKKQALERSDFNVELVFHYCPNQEPETIFMHTEKGDIPVRNISELVRFCKTLPSDEEEPDGFMAFLKDIMDSKNDND